VQVEADLLRRVTTNRSPTMIIVVGIGRQISMYEVNNMASWPYDRNAIIVRSFDDLSAVEPRLTDAICGGNCIVMSLGIIISYSYCYSKATLVRR